MKFLILFLAVLPLAWCGKPITACKCARVDCPSVNEAEVCIDLIVAPVKGVVCSLNLS